jgi:hypothetical protein
MFQDEAKADVAAELVVLGGQAETYEVSEETMKEIQSVAADDASGAGEAADKAAEGESTEDES